MKLMVDMTSAEDMARAISLLTSLTGGVSTATSVTVTETTPGLTEDSGEDFSDMLGGTEGGDELDSLLGGAEVEPELPTVEDMKAAVSAAIGKKGKEATTAMVQKVFAKLSVKKMSDIKEEKRQSFIDVMAGFAAQK